MIGRHNYLVLHKPEWERLSRKSMPVTIDRKKEEYIKSLNEQSQNWIKLWPDSIQGHVNHLKKEKITERAKLIETVKEFSLRKKQANSTDAVQRAKDLIFADSCYGRQLLSALLESKVFEERDLQLKFKKDTIETTCNALKINEPKGLSLFDSKQMELNEITSKLRRNQIAKEVAKCNADMVEHNKENRIKEIEENVFEDARLNKELIKREAEIKTKMAYLEKHAIKEYEIENALLKDLRAKREEQDERRREIWRKYHDRITYREKVVFNKIHQEKYDSLQSQKVFRTIQNSIENKLKKYNEFVQKGIEKWLDRSKQQEQKETDKKLSLCNERKTLDTENKIQAELLNCKRMSQIKKCVCSKQCIKPKCSDIPKQTATAKKKADGPASSFLSYKNKHLDELRARKSEPTPWNALKASHEQFSQYASETLQECRYKNAARKVVDDYRRINCLDPKSLPVSNYY